MIEQAAPDPRQVEDDGNAEAAQVVGVAPGTVTITAKAPSIMVATTRSPAATRLTPSPTARTVPAASAPGTKGSAGFI